MAGLSMLDTLSYTMAGLCCRYIVLLCHRPLSAIVYKIHCLILDTQVLLDILYLCQRWDMLGQSEQDKSNTYP